MYHMTRSLLLFCLFLLPWGSGWAQGDATEITILAEEFWPYSFTSASGQAPQGILVDFAGELLEAAGMEQDLQLLPWPRVMQQLRQHPNQVILTLIRTPERESLVHWVGPVDEINHALYGNATMTNPPTNLEQARHLYVSTVVDDVASNYLEQNAFTNLVRTSDHLKGLEMLTRGRVDLYPGNTALIDYQCAQLADGCENIRLMLTLTELEQDLYFALSAGTEQSVVNAIREQFNRLIANGRLKAISDAFLNADQN